MKKSRSKTAEEVPGRGEVLVPGLRRGLCKPGHCHHVCTYTKWCTLDPHTAHYHHPKKGKR